MQQVRLLQLFILISLATTLTDAQNYIDREGCNVWCGAIMIPYPFGIGINCSVNEWYTVDCNSSTPYLPAFNNVEVLSIDFNQQTVTVNVSVITDCQNQVQDSNLLVSTGYGRNPFKFSGWHNILVAEGCGSAAIMDKNGSVVSGCSTTCGNDTVGDLTNCFGVGCCQTTFPHDLESFTFNLTGLERQAGDGSCGSAFLVDTNLFVQGRFYRHSVVVGRSFVPISLSWNVSGENESIKCKWCEINGGFCSPDAMTGVSNCDYFGSKKKRLGVILAKLFFPFLAIHIYNNKSH